MFKNIESEDNSKIQKNNNCSPIIPDTKNNISEKDKKDEENIKKINLLIEIIKKTEEDLTNSKNKNQRNLSNLAIIKINENKEDETGHSYSNIAIDLSKELIDKQKTEITNSNFTLSQIIIWLLIKIPKRPKYKAKI